MRHLCAQRTNPIMGRPVRRVEAAGQVVSIEGNLGHEQQQRSRQQRHADNVIKAVVR